jgi:hypothetical protein
MEDRYQKELFEDLDRLKKSSLKNDNLVPKTKFSLTLSLEKTVFISIAVVMAMVVVYAVGIERGKTVERESPQMTITKTIKSVTVGGPKPVHVVPSTPKMASVVEKKVQVVEKKIQVPVQVPAPVAQTVQAAVVPAQPQQALPVKAETVSIQALPLSAQPKPYTIVGATFTRKDWADKEIEKLKKSGQEAAVYQSANYFLVCIGSYQTKDEAKAALTKIRNAYKDAYLRSR